MKRFILNLTISVFAICMLVAIYIFAAWVALEIGTLALEQFGKPWGFIGTVISFVFILAILDALKDTCVQRKQIKVGVKV